MKASEQNLEKLIKRIAKSQEVSEDQLLFHWDGLGATGDRVVMRVLRRQRGWDAIVGWASRHPETRERLNRLIDRAGITDEAVNALRRLEIQPAPGETQRTLANGLVNTIQTDASQNWAAMHSTLLQDPDLASAVVELLEESPSAAAFSFLMALLDLPLGEDLHRLIRKSLYHLRQKGFEVQEKTALAKADKELFFFGENRLALWHPLFYFRNTSAFSNLGDLYIMMIEEGKDFETSERQNSVRLDSGRLQAMAVDYSRRLREHSGLDIPFQQVSSEQAHYLLSRSASLLQGTPGEQRINDFLRFIGPSQAPAPPPVSEPAEMSEAQLAYLLSTAYFANWFLPAAAVDDFFASIEAGEKGAIILPEPRQRELRRTAAAETFAKYFNTKNRNVWSVAFEKAAVFLQNREPAGSSDAQAIAEAFRNEAISIEAIPAARILFDRTIEAIAKERQAQQETEKQSSLIMSPEDFARQQKPPRR